MKKLLSIILTLMLLLSVVPTGLFSITASAATSGYYTYSVENGKATITACITTIKGNITIPSTFDGYPVTSIGFRAFQGCTSLSSITIPNSVTEIGYESFKGCTSLSSITIPDSVTNIGKDAFYNTAYYDNSSNWENKVLYIGKHLIRAAASISGAYTIKSGTKTIVRDAFSNCTRLTSITIPESVAEISWNAFSNCTSLETVNYNATNCTTMGHPGYQAFSGCTNLITVNIGENVTNIPSYAFYNCSKLTSITIPGSVKSIGYYAFYYCENLKSITVAQENANYSSTDGVLFNKDKTILFFYPVGKTDISYSIPNSVTSIDNYAFENCTWLGSITIGGSVASIGERAFYNCTSLKSINIPDSVTEVGDYAFSDCSSLESVTIGNRVSSIGVRAFSNCSLLEIITIPDSITEIGEGAFYYCENLESVTIKGSVTSIGNNVFSDTAYYKNSSNWEDDVLYIDNHLIKAKTSISDAYTIKDGTKTIAGGAFYNCTSLKNITIPDSVTSIDNYAFENCTSLGSIIVSEDNMNYTSVDGVLFNKDKTILFCYPIGKTDKSYSIPNSVTEIGYGAFYNCTSLENITIPNNVTQIDYESFNGCTSLSSISIPDSVTKIGERAFYACSSLKSITLPFVGASRTASGTKDAVFGYIFGSGSSSPNSTQQYYGTYSSNYYYIPSSLKSVTITDSKQIPYGAFSNCISLESITIPNSVTMIGYRAFYNCISLKNITISNSITEIGYEIFYNCNRPAASPFLIA